MVRRAGSRSGPEELAFGFENAHVVNARFSATHQAVLVELPQLVAVAAMPLAAGIMPLVLEPHRDPVVGKGPQILHEPIVEFAIPLAGEKAANRLAAGDELAPVTPHRILAISQRDALRVTGVPGIFGEPDFSQCRDQCEWGSNCRLRVGSGVRSHCEFLTLKWTWTF